MLTRGFAIIVIKNISVYGENNEDSRNDFILLFTSSIITIYFSIVRGYVMKIVVDTREQKPYWKEGPEIIRRGLKTGDYSIEGYEDKICIERKSLPDLFGTLGKGHTRFKKELERARELDYFAILIDGSMSSCVNKDFKGSKHSMMAGHVVLKILFTLHIKYGVNFFFSNGRHESRRLIKGLFESWLKQQEKQKSVTK